MIQAASEDSTQESRHSSRVRAEKRR